MGPHGFQGDRAEVSGGGRFCSLIPLSALTPLGISRRSGDLWHAGRVFRSSGMLGGFIRVESTRTTMGSTMYAVIRTGGKQYRVAEGDVLRIEKVSGDVGAEVTFNDVLLLGGSDSPKVGQPTVSGAKVLGKILAQDKH